MTGKFSNFLLVKNWNSKAEESFYTHFFSDHRHDFRRHDSPPRLALTPLRLTCSSMELVVVEWLMENPKLENTSLVLVIGHVDQNGFPSI
jgi:hypothetical protein